MYLDGVLECPAVGSGGTRAWRGNCTGGQPGGLPGWILQVSRRRRDLYLTHLAEGIPVTGKTIWI